MAANIGSVSLDLHPSGPRAWKPDDANAWAQAITTGVNNATTDVAAASAAAAAAAASVGSVVDTGVTALSSSGVARFRLRGTHLEVSVSGGPWVGVATSGLFCVRDYPGGTADGLTDNTDAIEAALAAAKTYYDSTGTLPTVFFHQGQYLYRRPMFVTERITLLGEARGAARFAPIATQPTVCHCHPFIFAPRLDNGYAYGPEANGSYVAALVGSGNALHTFKGTSGSALDNNFIFDISQATAGRLPANGNPWTISMKRKFDTLVEYEHIFAIAGSIYDAAQPMLDIFWNSGGVKLSFRFNGKSYDVSCAFTGQPAPSLAINTLYDFELSWDGFTAMRLFLNGELWTLGAWNPGPAAGVVITGSSDGSGMVQYEYESIQIGCGFASAAFSSDITGAYQKGTWDVFHLSNSVRHTSGFTPASTKGTADGNTRVLINFTERYKGCLVADGMLGLHKIYYYPGVRTQQEVPDIKLQNLYFFTGLGALGTFNSGMRIEDVSYSLIEDGCSFFGNGYFSHIRNLDIYAGRCGFNVGSGSYWDMIGVTSAAPVPYLSNGGNLFGMNINATVHTNAFAGLVCSLGTVEFTGFNIDAEENSTVPWAGAIRATDMVSLKLNSPTLYNPVNKRTNDPVVVLSRTAGSAINWVAVLDTPGFIPSSVAPVIQTIGTETYWPRPIQMRSPVYQDGSTPTVCNIPTNVVDPDDHAALNRHGYSAAPLVGQWRRGTVFWNDNGLSGAPMGWKCTVAGTPGTWVPLANIP